MAAASACRRAKIQSSPRYPPIDRITDVATVRATPCVTSRAAFAWSCRPSAWEARVVIAVPMPRATLVSSMTTGNV